MSTDTSTSAGYVGRPAPGPRSKIRRLWSAVTALLLADIFIEAVFAGAMLSGAPWARAAHAANAGLLIVSTILAGLVAVATLRRMPHGLNLGLTLLALAAVMAVQAAVGAISGKGVNLLWVHVPLGVALVGFAAQALAGARRLGGGTDPKPPRWP
jgi:hypothetical protein